MKTIDMLPSQTTGVVTQVQRARDGLTPLRIGAWMSAGMVGAGMLAVGALLLLQGNAREVLSVFAMTIAGGAIAAFAWRNINRILASFDASVAGG